LEDLDLWINDIKDISSLKKLVNLEKLDLNRNPIPNNQIKELQKALPKCKIVY
jgi:Leucine-rich repeat (LRR) protein